MSLPSPILNSFDIFETQALYFSTTNILQKVTYIGYVMSALLCWGRFEIWLSILVRKLLKRGSFTSVEDLQARVLAFIDYYNQTMAKPFKWTYQGKALMA
jgi:hypothetical protein